MRPVLYRVRTVEGDTFDMLLVNAIPGHDDPTTHARKLTRRGDVVDIITPLRYVTGCESYRVSWTEVRE